MIQNTDPYGDGSGGGGGGIDTGITGGTDPADPPSYRPPGKIGGNGWWVYISGMWRWFSDPVAPTVKQVVP